MWSSSIGKLLPAIAGMPVLQEPQDVGECECQEKGPLAAQHGFI